MIEPMGYVFLCLTSNTEHSAGHMGTLSQSLILNSWEGTNIDQCH